MRMSDWSSDVCSSDLIEAVLHRKGGASSLTKDAPVNFGPFVFDPAMRQLLRDGEPVKLTGGEINLLEALVRNAGKPLSRERLLALARDHDGGARNDRAIDIAILRLRRATADTPTQPRRSPTVPTSHHPPHPSHHATPTRP